MKYAASIIFIALAISGCGGNIDFSRSLPPVEFDFGPESRAMSSEYQACVAQWVQDDYRYAFAPSGRLKETARENHPGLSQFELGNYSGYRNVVSLKRNNDGQSAIELFAPSANPAYADWSTKSRC